MNAPKNILEVWRKFDGVGMDTITKAFFYDKRKKRQRTVAEMKEHYEGFGAGGNCFDLAIWLLAELKEAGIEAYPIGHDFFDEKAHVALIALGEDGEKYYCDLGDQWIQPILIEKNDRFIEGKLAGFFPGAYVKVETKEKEFNISYIRNNGKISIQTFPLTRYTNEDLLRAGELSQARIWKALCEKRVRREGTDEVTHWEFYNWKSFESSLSGLNKEPELSSKDEWAERIALNMGMDLEFVKAALSKFEYIEK
ncbi:hypothetical protein LC085_04080 [Bacillus tianshenii]|uniref:hypothetical protein n=1 Tax=Sutcliffiella tianshenii TaxID=1463404 RepID=UPI001CD73B47|nr:hypothetical protein [Bacillus tianshenii]MCA1319081.1 hypothetical protein [Bacillus tianshenii]